MSHASDVDTVFCSWPPFGKFDNQHTSLDCHVWKHTTCHTEWNCFIETMFHYTSNNYYAEMTVDAFFMYV